MKTTRVTNTKLGRHKVNGSCSACINLRSHNYQFKCATTRVGKQVDMTVSCLGFWFYKLMLLVRVLIPHFITCSISNSPMFTWLLGLTATLQRIIPFLLDSRM